MERGVIVRGIALGVAAMLVIAAVTALWVFVYSLAVAPGHDGSHYQAEGQRVAPLVSIVLGLPVLLAAGWLAARGARPLAAAFIPALAYVLLDLALSAAGGIWVPLWALALSWSSKVVAAGAGGWLVLRRGSPAA